jgi:hypothetical protein
MLSLRQQIVVGKAALPGATVQNLVWVGTPGGAALATDPNPNSTPPASNRIVRGGGLNPAGELYLQGHGLFLAQCIGGTSCTVQIWFFDATQAQWIQTQIPTTITIATSPQGFFNVYALLGAKFFCQLTANTGVQAIGYGWF